MKTNQTIIIILVLVILALGLYTLAQPKKVDTGIVSEPNTPVMTTSTPQATTTAPTPNPVVTTPTQPVQTVPKQVTVSTGNSYTFPDGMVLSVKRVDDSRCPTNVVCIWAGNITATFNIKKGNVNQEFKLIYGAGDNGNNYTYGGYVFDLVGVTPDKGRDENQIAQGEYKLMVNISK